MAFILFISLIICYIQHISSFTIHSLTRPITRLYQSTNTETTNVNNIIFPDSLGDEWEIDCYSRPVVTEDGKKLWEILITDSIGDFRYLKTIPSSLVNSRNLRQIVEEVIDASPVRPKLIRFFRSQMFNMISIALSTIEVDIKPSRLTHNLLMWLQDREANVYPYMIGK